LRGCRHSQPQGVAQWNASQELLTAFHFKWHIRFLNRACYIMCSTRERKLPVGGWW
jgi:hypothetical protein